VWLQVSCAVEPSGELNVGLCYNDHTQRLIVSVVEARNLKAAALENSSSGAPPPPRLRTNLIPRHQFHRNLPATSLTCQCQSIIFSVA